MNAKVKSDRGILKVDQSAENASQQSEPTKPLSDTEIQWNAMVSEVVAVFAKKFQIRDSDRLHELHQAVLKKALKKGDLGYRGVKSWLRTAVNWTSASLYRRESKKNKKKGSKVHAAEETLGNLAALTATPANENCGEDCVVYNSNLLNGYTAPTLPPEVQVLLKQAEECCSLAKEETIRAKPDDFELLQDHREKGIEIPQIAKQKGLAPHTVTMRISRFDHKVAKLTNEKVEKLST